MDTIWVILLVIIGSFILLPLFFIILDILGKIIKELGVIGIILVLLFIGFIVYQFNS